MDTVRSVEPKGSIVQLGKSVQTSGTQICEQEDKMYVKFSIAGL